ncbi:MAG: hypothetical protein HGA45_02665 [Chloroflexales bacterium]|nr:hypothetical protein [Chloroflexales bacterium]
MDDEQLNMEIRRFLKRFGVSAQRVIEDAVRQAVAAGTLPPDGTVTVRARLEIAGLAADHLIEEELHLG